MTKKNDVYRVPKNNREVFVDPPVDRIQELVQSNRKKILEYRGEIAGIPFQELRDKIRSDIVYWAAGYTEKVESLHRKGQPAQYSSHEDGSQKNLLWKGMPDKPWSKGKIPDYPSIKDITIIQTGHEPILYYPGIWIKNHLAYHLSKKLHGIGVNMIVDNDACNMGFLYMPVLSETLASVQKVLFVEDDKQKTAYEEIVFHDIKTILQFKEDVLLLFRKNTVCQNLGKPIEDMQAAFERFMNTLEEYYYQGCTDMVTLLTAARRTLEKDFCMNNLEIPVSRMCDTDGFYYFLLHIFHNADRFIKIYNDTLIEYRRIHKIRSRANPLPDMKIEGNFIEVPFWIWKAGGRRRRCFVVHEKESIKVTDGSNILVTLKKGKEIIQNVSELRALADTGMKIRPRAITITMFSRIFFSDIFIHGIGGAKYDMITDEIIRKFFGIDHPAFVTISATLFLPFDLSESDTEDLQRLRNNLRRMTYSPERYAPAELQNSAEFRQRVEEKQTLLKMMAKGNKDDKRRYFQRIRELNTVMVNQIRDELLRRQWEVNTMRNHLKRNEVIKFREYPIYIYPKRILREYFLNLFSSGA
ncbi:MAG: hypothetical protein E3K32_05495 [wastewater metagenome]|nr:hypothetical protein [Candidatus Loosdrechtia aerotolerans]